MRKVFFLLIFISSLVFAEKLEKSLEFVGNDGKKTSIKIVCNNGKEGMVYIDNATKEMTINDKNEGKLTIPQAIEKICK